MASSHPIGVYSADDASITNSRLATVLVTRNLLAKHMSRAAFSLERCPCYDLQICQSQARGIHIVIG